MFLLVNTFHEIRFGSQQSRGMIVSRHRSARAAFARLRAIYRAPYDRPAWLCVVDMGGARCPRGAWAPWGAGTIVDWEGQ